jgi:hypothetical protein
MTNTIRTYYVEGGKRPYKVEQTMETWSHTRHVSSAEKANTMADNLARHCRQLGTEVEVIKGV